MPVPKEATVKPKTYCLVCHLVKTAPPHATDHDFVAPPKEGGFGQKRKPLAPRSEAPNRVQRYEESQRGMQEHREAVRHCEGPAYGLETPCGVGADATLEQSHTIGRGMGGGKDYGVLATLCRKHHREVDTDRDKAREVGLSVRPPVPENVVPRFPRRQQHI